MSYTNCKQTMLNVEDGGVLTLSPRDHFDLTYLYVHAEEAGQQDVLVTFTNSPGALHLENGQVYEPRVVPNEEVVISDGAATVVFSSRCPYTYVVPVPPL